LLIYDGAWLAAPVADHRVARGRRGRGRAGGGRVCRGRRPGL